MAGKERQLAGLLGKVQAAFGKQDSFGLRELGNKAIEEAALRNDRDLAEVALIAYCLHKLLSKQHIVRHAKWGRVKKAIEEDLKRAGAALEKGKMEKFEKSMQEVIGNIQVVDGKLGNYAQGLYEKAKVKYASSAYALGLGLGQAAGLTGADKKNLLNYIGFTRVHDREAITFGIRERLAKLKKRIGGK